MVSKKEFPYLHQLQAALPYWLLQQQEAQLEQVKEKPTFQSRTSDIDYYYRNKKDSFEKGRGICNEKKHLEDNEKSAKTCSKRASFN